MTRVRGPTMPHDVVSWLKRNFTQCFKDVADVELLSTPRLTLDGLGHSL